MYEVRGMYMQWLVFCMDGKAAESVWELHNFRDQKSETKRKVCIKISGAGNKAANVSPDTKAKQTTSRVSWTRYVLLIAYRKAADTHWTNHARKFQ
jgi:hypothetical protein